MPLHEPVLVCAVYTLTFALAADCVWACLARVSVIASAMAYAPSYTGNVTPSFAHMQATIKRRGMLSAQDLAASARLATQAAYMLQLAAQRAAATAATARAASLSAVLQRVALGADGSGGGGVAAGVLDELTRSVLGAHACHLVPSPAVEAAEGWTYGNTGSTKVRCFVVQSTRPIAPCSAPGWRRM